MAGRITRIWRTSAHLLTAAAAVAAAACSNSADSVGTTDPTPTPSETPTASPSDGAPPSETASPSTRPSPLGSQSPVESPSPTDTTTPSQRPSPSPVASEPPESATPTPVRTVVPGRPLRQRRRLLTPSVGGGAGVPPHPDHERLAALPAPLRQELYRRWLAAARMEHASVPAFAELALLLAAVGAPLELVAEAHAAALDEVEHTRLAYALANAYGATVHAPGTLPALLGRRAGRRFAGRERTLARIAVDALRDGCLNEGAAATLARVAAEQATDPAARAALTLIARDEVRHAELSWRVLGWALDAGGPRVRRAVERALAALPTLAAEPGAGLAEHGWPDESTQATVVAEVRRDVVERARGLVAMTPAAR